MILGVILILLIRLLAYNICKKEGGYMKKLCAIFLSIIIILIIILSIVTIKYLKLRDKVYEYFGNYEFTYYNETLEKNK